MLHQAHRRVFSPSGTPAGRDGGRVREEAAAVRAVGLRLRSARGLAGEPAAEALPGLEEAETAGQAGGDAEKAGPVLNPVPLALADPSAATSSSPARGFCPSRFAAHSPPAEPASSRSGGEQCLEWWH